MPSTIQILSSIPIGLAFLLAGGCVAVPAADGPTLSVAEARSGERAEASGEPLSVRWGGTIAEVRNTAESTTVLEIVSRPLRPGGRPRGGDATEGRFLAEVDAFLDPEIVVAGRDVTVTGELAGQREGSIGETPYTYPVVRVDTYRYWEPERVQNHFPHYYPGHDIHDDPWHDRPHSPNRRHRRSAVSVGGGVSF